MPALSHAALNNTVWTLSLVLQIALVAALVARRIAPRLPCFTALIAFYPVRAALLFTLFGHITPASYASLYSTLSFLDILLQAIVAVEIVFHLVRGLGGFTRLRGLLLLLLLAFAAGATLLILARLPAYSPIPADRAQTVLSFFMLALFVWVIAASSSPLLRPVALGLGLQASISLISQTGRITAAIHRDADAYARWAYISAAGYLIVVCLWLLTLKHQPSAPSQQSSS